MADWLPRLAKEGIEGADAIFACLGPAMEVYSRYERVETAAGEPVPLSPPDDDPDRPAFLPAVWAAVAREALRMIFEGPEAEGFEADARLTALWLWTLRAAANGKREDTEQAEVDEEEDEEAGKAKQLKGLALDYDTARKLAQALGAHLEDLGRPGGIVEVKKGVARLLPVAERRKALLGEAKAPRRRGGTLFDKGEETHVGGVQVGRTALDRVHQAMLLFSDGRGDALRRLLAEPGYVDDARFRKLAQALAQLYPSKTEERRWVEGVIATVRQARGG